MPHDAVASAPVAFQPAKLTYHAGFGLEVRRTRTKSEEESPALYVEPVLNLVNTPLPVAPLDALPGVRQVVFS